MASFIDVPDEELCQVCMDAPFNTAIIPCGHTLLCRSCAEQLQTCPLCRTEIQGLLQVHLSVGGGSPAARLVASAHDLGLTISEDQANEALQAERGDVRRAGTRLFQDNAGQVFPVAMPAPHVADKQRVSNKGRSKDNKRVECSNTDLLARIKKRSQGRSGSGGSGGSGGGGSSGSSRDNLTARIKARLQSSGAKSSPSPMSNVSRLSKNMVLLKVNTKTQRKEQAATTISNFRVGHRVNIIKGNYKGVGIVTRTTPKTLTIKIDGIGLKAGIRKTSCQICERTM